MMPSITAGTNCSPALVLAMESANWPMAPLLKVYCWLKNIINAVASAPTKLPKYTMPQFLSSSPVPTLRLAQAITIRLLPVNSSAPPTTTRIRPKLKTSPIRIRTKPVGQVVLTVASAPVVINEPAPTVVAKIAPSAMKAPASTASANIVTFAMCALRTPISSALTAIAGGSRASIWTSLTIRDFFRVDIRFDPDE